MRQRTVRKRRRWQSMVPYPSTSISNTASGLTSLLILPSKKLTKIRKMERKVKDLEKTLKKESRSEPEYNESSDEYDVGASDKSGNYLQGEMGSSTTFLLGVRSRFGRAI